MKDFKVYQTSGMLNFLVSEASDVRKKEQTLSGDIVSFSADEQSPLKIVVDIDSTGWTGCEVDRTGVNVWDEEVESGIFDTTTGNPIAISAQIRTKNYVPVVGGQIYRMVTTTSPDGVWMLFYDSNKNLLTDGLPNIGSVANNARKAINGVSIPMPLNCSYVRFYFQAAYGNTYNNDTSINYPSTDTSYHAYSGTTLSVTFPNEVGTITDGTLTIDYDGSVTLKTGGQTYTLTSVSPIETLIGDNNIWADAGPVSVTYPI